MRRAVVKTLAARNEGEVVERYAWIWGRPGCGKAQPKDKDD